MTKSQKTNALIEEYVTLTELADARELNSAEQARIPKIREELQALAGEGRSCWREEQGGWIEHPNGWILNFSWTDQFDGHRWYPELFQARAALALRANGRLSGKGMSATLPAAAPGLQSGNRAWIERTDE